jgi:hypothetical protein
MVWSETTSLHVATVRCCRADIKCLSHMGKTRRLHSSRAKAQTQIFYWLHNQVKRHKVHPRNYPGCPPFRERAKRKRQPSSGEAIQALLLNYLLQQLAPTLVAAFHKAPTPDFRYLECRSNHSTTVAVPDLVCQGHLRSENDIITS